MPNDTPTAIGADALPDAVRLPLDSLHADAAYLIGRLRDESLPAARVVDIIRERIDAAKAALASATPPAADTVTVRYDLSPAAIEGAVRDKLIEMGWTPPDAAAPKAAPAREHDLQDVRCECCGYMTYHREHMGCIRADFTSHGQAAAPAAVAYRVLRKRHDGEWVTDGRGWCDGAPAQELVADIALRSDSWRIEYAYAAPTTQAAPTPAAQGDALTRALEIALDAALDFAGTVAGGASWWDDVWANHEAAIDAARAAKEGAGNAR